jgi:DNA-binding MarR family transcriptional regulator
MSNESVVILSTPEGREIVRNHCRASKVRVAIFQELVEAELEQTGKKRKAGLSDRFDDILDRMDEE